MKYYPLTYVTVVLKIIYILLITVSNDIHKSLILKCFLLLSEMSEKPFRCMDLKKDNFSFNNQKMKSTGKI